MRKRPLRLQVAAHVKIVEIIILMRIVETGLMPVENGLSGDEIANPEAIVIGSEVAIEIVVLAEIVVIETAVKEIEGIEIAADGIFETIEIEVLLGPTETGIETEITEEIEAKVADTIETTVVMAVEMNARIEIGKKGPPEGNPMIADLVMNSLMMSIPDLVVVTTNKRFETDTNVACWGLKSACSVSKNQT